MKNIIILMMLIALFVFSFINEPIDDTIDLFAGATSDTYSAVDSIAGATEDDDEDEDDVEDEEDDD